MLKHRVLLALRLGSPVERLLRVATSLAKRMNAELEVLADPGRPDWRWVETEVSNLTRNGTPSRITPIADLKAKDVVSYAHRHECIISVVVGRPAAWSIEGQDPWARLDCPLIAASDHPDLPEET